MKVAIIGSNSFLAKYIIREFINCNIKPTLFGTLPSAEFPNLKFYHFKIPVVSIPNSTLLEFDIIIYTAGAGIQSGLIESLEIIYELNCFYPIKLINFFSQNNFRGIVITFGSYFEIGDEKEELFYTEIQVALSNKQVPNHYSSSKRILTRFLISSPDLPNHFHFILPNIYGKGENQNRLIPYLIDSIREATEVKLTSGSQIRQYIHGTDVSKAVLNVVTNGYPKGLYNLCNSEAVQIKELVRNVYKVMNREADFLKIEFGSNQRADTSMDYLLLNNNKATFTLKFSPSISLQEGISSYL